MIDKREPAESTDRTEPAEPIENAERNDPTEPIEHADPIEPMDRTDPLEPIESTDCSDHSDHRDLDRVVLSIPHPASCLLPAASCRCPLPALRRMVDRPRTSRNTQPPVVRPGAPGRAMTVRGEGSPGKDRRRGPVQLDRARDGGGSLRAGVDRRSLSVAMHTRWRQSGMRERCTWH